MLSTCTNMPKETHWSASLKCTNNKERAVKSMRSTRRRLLGAGAAGAQTTADPVLSRALSQDPASDEAGRQPLNVCFGRKQEHRFSGHWTVSGLL